MKQKFLWLYSLLSGQHRQQRLGELGWGGWGMQRSDCRVTFQSEGASQRGDANQELWLRLLRGELFTVKFKEEAGFK